MKKPLPQSGAFLEYPCSVNAQKDLQQSSAIFKQVGPFSNLVPRRLEVITNRDSYLILIKKVV